MYQWETDVIEIDWGLLMVENDFRLAENNDEILLILDLENVMFLRCCTDNLF